MRLSFGKCSYLRLIDSCITQLKAQGPSMTCKESKEEEEMRRVISIALPKLTSCSVKRQVHGPSPDAGVEVSGGSNLDPYSFIGFGRGLIRALTVFNQDRNPV